MADDPVFIVCARADTRWAVSGSTFDQRCPGCGAYVMIAPSGQQSLREIPTARIICLECFRATVETGATVEVEFAADRAELAAEVASIEPNPRRYRN